MSIWKRIIASYFHVKGLTPDGRLWPECETVVEIDEDGVVIAWRDGRVDRVAWDELDSVGIRTNDLGPSVTDFFIVLISGEREYAIPQDATGESELLDRLRSLDGFNEEVFLNAMRSTDLAEFVCWRKRGSGLLG